MEPNSTFDPPPTSGPVPVAEAGGKSKSTALDSAALELEQTLQQNHVTRIPQDSVSAALAAARAEGAVALASRLRFPGEDGGRSMAEMAQRDLDAALQLLADRAQYITGATGAAIALRREGKSDMLCRASAGSNAPELGALLSTEFGLSGESVRTRQALRCDDAERDARVNREVCRQLGIASVVVMPVVNDDGVLGVFELFSGKANAFGERDLSAVQRLSEMVETAVRLAEAAEGLQERLKTQGLSATEVAEPGAGEIAEDEILEDLVPNSAVSDARVLSHEASGNRVLDNLVLDKQVLDDQLLDNQLLDGAVPEKSVPAGTDLVLEGSVQGGPAEPPNKVVARAVVEPEVVVDPVPAAAPAPSTEPLREKKQEEKKQLFWSAALKPPAEDAKPKESDQSHVPPVLRGLHKCEACGFPVSAGRVLCVECEEKKWRGQLKTPQAAARQSAIPVASPPRLASTVQPRVFDVTAQSAGAEKESTKVTDSRLQSLPAQDTSSMLVLSAGLEPSQSWLSANRYIVGALLAVAAIVGAFFFMR
jgi:GAF domain-containing protein